MKSLLQAFNSSFEQQKKDAVNLYIGKAKSPYVMNTKRKKKNKQRLGNKWDTTEFTNIYIMRIPKKRRETGNNLSNLIRLVFFFKGLLKLVYHRKMFLDNF